MKMLLLTDLSMHKPYVSVLSMQSLTLQILAFLPLLRENHSVATMSRHEYSIQQNN